MRSTIVLTGLFSLTVAVIETQSPATTSIVPIVSSQHASTVTGIPNAPIPELRQRALWDVNGVSCDEEGNCTCNGKDCAEKYNFDGINCMDSLGNAVICVCTAACGGKGYSQYLTPTGSVNLSGDWTSWLNVGASSTRGGPWYTPGATTGVVVIDGTTVAGGGATSTSKSTGTSEGAAAPTGRSGELALAGFAGFIGVAMAL